MHPSTARGRIPGYHTILPGRSVIDTGSLTRRSRLQRQGPRVRRVHRVGATVANQSVVNGYTGLGLKQNERRNNTISVSYNRVFNTNVINEARGGFNREHIYRHSNTTLGGVPFEYWIRSIRYRCVRSSDGPEELATFGHPAVSFSNVMQPSLTATGILIGRRTRIWLRSETLSLGSSGNTA